MTVIKVENLGKKYIIDHQKRENRYRYETLGGALANCGKRAVNFLRHPIASLNNTVEHEEFWALKDINFQINQGDRVGIIGRNGAGKSTLLKILSRITAPTTGQVRIKGRVSSLLEVGTGFHPELTGRENIYLNGAILGMKRYEIKAKFDEIVAFAEVEKFLDTPVKHYSSGMYVRLAFAVAAYLEPEILIVDEVLAVGDAQFQKKCLGKMEAAGNQGRTVLFVSHNMAMISNLCQTGVVLDKGKVSFVGDTSSAILHYYQELNESNDFKSMGMEGKSVALINSELIINNKNYGITIHDELTVRMKYRIKQSIKGRCVPNFHFFTPDGSYAFVSNPENISVMPIGDYIADCKIPGNLLNEGTYFVGLAITTYYEVGSYEVEFFDRNALTFTVIDPMDERSNRYGYAGPVPGFLRPKCDWQISTVN